VKKRAFGAHRGVLCRRELHGAACDPRVEVIMDSDIEASVGEEGKRAPPLMLLDSPSESIRHGRFWARGDRTEPEGAPTGPDVTAREWARIHLFRPEALRQVKRWLRKLGVSKEDLDDVVQAVMLQAVRSFPSYDADRGRPERWLNAIAVHVAAHYHNSANTRRRCQLIVDEGREEVTDARPTPEEELAAAETVRGLGVALAELRPHLRGVLIEHDLEGIPIAEIARARGTVAFTMYKWRARAMAQMRATLARIEPIDRYP
jgi:RNA polymerase sigma-70 factor, ECF subfamily